jgi:hypothetical protein
MQSDRPTMDIKNSRMKCHMLNWLKKLTNIHKNEMAKVGLDKLQIEEMSSCDILSI